MSGEPLYCAGDRDTIVVPPGTYPMTSWLFQTLQSVTVRAPGGSAVTKLDAGGTGNNVKITSGGVVTIEGLTITGVNGAPAVYIEGPDTILRGVSVENNRHGSILGGGIRIQSGQVDLIRSAVTDNKIEGGIQDAQGGGIAISGGSLNVVASTIARNLASAMGVGVEAYGGGLYVSGGAQVKLRHVTLRGNRTEANSAARYGGNVYIWGGSAVEMSDSIVLDGEAAFAGNCYLNGGSGSTFTATGRNIFAQSGSDSCSFPVDAIASASAGTGDLGSHGGVGLTYVPLPGTAAVDAASSCPAGGLDQRGSKLPVGKACDIGAIDLASDLEVKLSAAPGPVAPGTQVAHTAVVVNNGFDDISAVALSLTSAGGLSDVWTSHGSCTAAGKCTLGSLPVGSSKAVTFTAKAPSSGQLSARAVATSPVPDPNPANGDVTATTAVTVAAGAPVITKLRALGKLRSGKRGKIGFSLSRDASVKVVVSRVTNGRRDGRRCRATAKKGKRCKVLRRARRARPGK